MTETHAPDSALPCSDYHAAFAPAAPPPPLPRAPLRLSCVVPAHNEEANLERFVRALAQAVQPLTAEFEIIIVNDGSRDATHEVALRLAQGSGLPLRYIALSRNFGKEAALTAGIDHARGNAVLLIDADFQHPLDLLPQMHQLWLAGFDMVYGVIADRGGESGTKRVGTGLFYRVLNAGSHVKVPPNAGDFRWMDRRVADALKALPERQRFMKGLYAWVGFKSAALPFVPADRAAGQSSFNLRRLGSLALLGLISFTTLPLRLWSVMGSVIALIALAYGLLIVLDTLLFGADLEGWPTLAAAIMLFSGVQLMSIGILGEYIGRIYDEVKQRPAYLVARDEDHSPLRERP
ncbi:glycosyltransferase family 2 protein [Comamonas faecalis]|uniref:Glycosyltransferase family 2 protein n=1 Tax=Comamonas faecalis TaxID=1387849 RepID=A0ABP7RLL4_9BURK